MAEDGLYYSSDFSYGSSYELDDSPSSSFDYMSIPSAQPRDQTNESPTPAPVPTPHVQVDSTDPSTFFSSSLSETKEFLRGNLGLSTHDLRHAPHNGLIVLSLNDFSLIRNDLRNSRIIPHLIYFPPFDENGERHFELSLISKQFRLFRESFNKS